MKTWLHRKNCLLFFLLLAVSCSPVTGVHDSLNFFLFAGKRECFFEDFDNNSPTRTIEVFVQSGGTANVYLTIHGPLRLEDIREDKFENAIVKENVDANMESQSETSTFVTDFKPKESGTYAICLDNRHSVLFPKVVQLDVRLASQPEPIVLKMAGELSESEQEALLARAKESISRIRKGLTKILIQQQKDRHRLKLHSEMNKRSNRQVLFGSILETACFIGAALFQIFFVRRWFAAKLNTNRQWA